MATLPLPTQKKQPWILLSCCYMEAGLLMKLEPGLRCNWKETSTLVLADSWELPRSECNGVFSHLSLPGSLLAWEPEFLGPKSYGVVSVVYRGIRWPTVQGYLGHRKFSVQIKVILKTGKVLSKWGHWFPKGTTTEQGREICWSLKTWKQLRNMTSYVHGHTVGQGL